VSESPGEEASTTVALTPGRVSPAYCSGDADVDAQDFGLRDAEECLVGRAGLRGAGRAVGRGGGGVCGADVVAEVDAPGAVMDAVEGRADQLEGLGFFRWPLTKACAAERLASWTFFLRVESVVVLLRDGVGPEQVVVAGGGDFREGEVGFGLLDAFLGPGAVAGR